MAIIQTFTDEFTGNGRVIRDYFIGPGKVRETPKSLATKLGLKEAEVQKVLDHLVEFGIASKTEDKMPVYAKLGDFELHSNIVR